MRRPLLLLGFHHPLRSSSGPFFFSLVSLSWPLISFCHPRFSSHLKCCLTEECQLTHVWQPAFFHHKKMSQFNSRLVERETLLHGQAERVRPVGASRWYPHRAAAGVGRPLQHNPVETLEHPSPWVILLRSISFFLTSFGMWVRLYFVVLGGKPAGCLASRGHRCHLARQSRRGGNLASLNSSPAT